MPTALVELAALLLVEDGAERVHRSGGDLPAVVRGEARAVAERVRDLLGRRDEAPDPAAVGLSASSPAGRA